MLKGVKAEVKVESKVESKDAYLESELFDIDSSEKLLNIVR